MKARTRFILRMCLLFAIVLPIAVSFIFPSAVSPVDYIIQGALIISVFAVPFLGSKLGGVFGMPFLFGFIWGVWRLLYFDCLTENDIPGMGYIIVAIELGVIAMIIYGIRAITLKILRRRRLQKNS